MDAHFYALSTLELIERRGAAFTLSLPRLPVFWEALERIEEGAFEEALEMPGAQVAETTYSPQRWKGRPLRLIVRRVRVRASELSHDPRARRRRTIPRHQLQLALAGELDLVFAYSFILTNLPAEQDAREVELLHRRRGQIEERLKDAKLGTAARHAPSGDLNANRAWLAATMTALTLAAFTCDLHPDCRASLASLAEEAPFVAALAGAAAGEQAGEAEGAARRDRRPLRRHGKALRRLLYCVPARIARSGRRLILHLPRGLPWAASFERAYLAARALAPT
jgi:hypothetical protein